MLVLLVSFVIWTFRSHPFKSHQNDHSRNRMTICFSQPCISKHIFCLKSLQSLVEERINQISYATALESWNSKHTIFAFEIFLFWKYPLKFAVLLISINLPVRKLNWCIGHPVFSHPQFPSNFFNQNSRNNSPSLIAWLATLTLQTVQNYLVRRTDIYMPLSMPTDKGINSLCYLISKHQHIVLVNKMQQFTLYFYYFLMTIVILLKNLK